ncbi:MAG: hypothetical protein AWM53_01803 [Candidatus Dichloromethanomonas elyunquensis]|nr:MAG: hypothetical protein AWM53_01803 [Candidatus Dichloromethanomonas elyunquensis]
MPDKEEPELYAFDFFKTIFRIKKSLYNDLAGQFAHNLGAVELLAIHYLKHKGEIKTSVLSEYFGIPGSTLTGILDRMEKKDYIVRTRDPADRRVVLVKLNSKTLDSFPKTQDIIREFLRAKNINLTVTWWQDMTKELKKLESLLIETEESYD